MKKEIITIVCSVMALLFIISFVSASGFSPTSLIYELGVGERQCQTVSVTSDSEVITLTEAWAENKDIEWKVSNFDRPSVDHEIVLEYPLELSVNERQAEVCLTGNKVGEFHGVLLLKEQQEGNSIIQMGIWLKAIISDKQETPVSSVTDTGSGTVTFTVGGGSQNNANNENVAPESNLDDSIVESQEILADEPADVKANSITGGVIGSIGERGMIIFGVIALVGILAIGVFIKRRRKLRSEGFI